MWPHAKEGGREGYIERVNERAGKREEMVSEKNPNNMEEGSINGSSSRGRVGLTLKLDELL